MKPTVSRKVDSSDKCCLSLPVMAKARSVEWFFTVTHLPGYWSISVSVFVSFLVTLPHDLVRYLLGTRRQRWALTQSTRCLSWLGKLSSEGLIYIILITCFLFRYLAFKFLWNQFARSTKRWSYMFECHVRVRLAGKYLHYCWNVWQGLA